MTKTPWTPREGFRQYAVTDVPTVEVFAHRYYKADRFRERGADYQAGILSGLHTELVGDGVCVISHHDSVTGEIVAFYGR